MHARSMPEQLHADQRVSMRAPWWHYEALLDLRGESSRPRLSYLDGVIELMSPSIDHETIKTNVARLLEIWAYESDVPLFGFGSWTLKDSTKQAGCEPDECYSLGKERPERPDIAIEVHWTHGGMEKLEIYRRLGVREVWMWEDGRIQVHALEDSAYVARDASAVLPQLDLAEICAYATQPQHAAVRAYGAAVRARTRPATT